MATMTYAVVESLDAGPSDWDITCGPTAEEYDTADELLDAVALWAADEAAEIEYTGELWALVYHEGGTEHRRVQ